MFVIILWCISLSVELRLLWFGNYSSISFSTPVTVIWYQVMVTSGETVIRKSIIRGVDGMDSIHTPFV